MSNDKRHKGGKKTFGEETFAEQAKSLTITSVWFLAATRNHIRKCAKEHGNIRAAGVPHKVAGQLRRIADRIDAIKPTAGMTVPVTIVKP
jgi:hypothetical protein